MSNQPNEKCENCNEKLGEHSMSVGVTAEESDRYDPNPGWKKSRQRQPYERMTRPPRISYERSVEVCSNECAAKMLLKWADEIMPGPPPALLEDK